MKWFCGLDISKHRVGICLAHNEIIIPLKIIKTINFEVEINKIKKQYGAVTFVIGIPHPQYENYKFIKHFTHKYRNILKPFCFHEEDYSSILATDVNNKVHDDVAACVILERFFICYNGSI